MRSRSVVEQDGNLYFGSYGRNYVFLIRVDENDRATVAFMAGKESTGAAIQYNSLRACGVYEGQAVLRRQFQQPRGLESG